jgi:hypothetical protein
MLRSSKVRVFKSLGAMRSGFSKKRIKPDTLNTFLSTTDNTRHPNAFEKDPQRREGILVLLEPNIAMAHQAIATQKNIKRVKVIQNPLESASPESSRFFEDLRESLNPFSIDTELAWEAPSLEQTSNIRNPTLDKNFDLSRT